MLQVENKSIQTYKCHFFTGRVSTNHKQRPRVRVHYILTLVILVFREAKNFAVTIVKHAQRREHEVVCNIETVDDPLSC